MKPKRREWEIAGAGRDLSGLEIGERGLARCPERGSLKAGQLVGDGSDLLTIKTALMLEGSLQQ